MLLVGGDSFSCWPLEEVDGHRRNCWPAMLADYLNLELTDYSISGCSNDRIFRYILPNITVNTTLVVILWSHTSRYELTNSKTSKIESLLPTDKTYNVQDWYLNYCRTLLYVLSISNTCKLIGVPLIQRLVFEPDCWWDNTLKSFRKQLQDNLLFDNFTDDMIQERFNYLKSLHIRIDSVNLNNSIQSFVETSAEYKNHPTPDGHKQIRDKIIEEIKWQNLLT